MFAAVDIGGTKTLVAVFDSHGEIIEQIKFPTNLDYDIFKVELADSIAKFTTKEFLRGAVGIPGKVDRTNGASVSTGPHIPWRNTPICADFEKIFSCPFLIENDAKLAGLSEAILLKDKYKKVMYLTISTGIGGAYVVDGVLDPSMIDAEVGHMVLEHRGKFLKWEDFASGKSIVEKYNKRAGEIEDPEVWKEIVSNLASGIINVIAMTVPEAIVIGGGVGTHFNKFGPQLIKYLKQYETPLMPIPPIMGAKHPEEAVIYGCYNYAKRRITK